MRVVIAGGHGQIALRLERLLTSRGDDALALVRNPDHRADVEASGAEAVVLDLERASAGELAAHLAEVDAVVFAAGAGPGSGIDRKDTVDRGAAVLLADAAVQAGVRRYLLVSSMGAGAEPPPGTDETFAAYLRAKTAAEQDVLARAELDVTVLRPGHLTDGAGTGRVTLATSVPRGDVPRDDVAAVLLALLDEPRTAGATLELVGGDDAVADAVRASASTAP
jgi:nucleoside-diphosphate-sugar epimerase